jgi:tetratricopeptide (TPR) repeat protein
MRFAVLLVVTLVTGTAYASPEEAAAENARAKQLYNAGDFAGSIEVFHKAYELDPQSEYLFGWAQALRRSGNCSEAMKLYTKLLALPLSEIDAAATRQAMARCEGKTQARTSPWYRDWGANALVIGGIVAIGGGAWLTVQSMSDEEAATNAMTYGEHERLTDRATILRIAGISAIALGTLSAAYGVSRYARRGRGRTVSAWLGGTSGGLAIGGTW